MYIHTYRIHTCTSAILQYTSAGIHVLNHCSVLQCVAVCCSVLQCVTVCCSVLQCVTVCCSVLQLNHPHIMSLVSLVASISRPLKIIGLFCKRALQKRLYSAQETYNFKEPKSCATRLCNIWWLRLVGSLKL